MIFSKSIVTVASLALVATGTPLVPRQTTSYDYIVVGSGAGGGPLAARLALAGKKTLLIDAGDDQGANVNYTVPAYQAKSTEDPELAWDFFVRHYTDDSRQARDFKTTYTLADGSEYIGTNPPQGAKIKGILYPRTATLGGCTAHNALVFVYPDKSDFQYIADLTGDNSWGPDNMRKYLVKAEKNTYLPPITPGHGFSGWLSTSVAPLTIAVRDSQLIQQLAGAAQALGGGPATLSNFYNLLAGDANADSTARDQNQALYQIPITSNDGQRAGSREFIVQVANAKNSDGSKKYPLTLQLNTLVTKVVFDKSQSPPRATGVEWLVGRHLYRADKRSGSAGPGVPGGASAVKEVIVAGGTYNSPQILKLSGVGPRAELEGLGIDVVADLPGVGNNLQDHYEVAVQGSIPKDYDALNGCNFAFAGQGKPLPPESDPCYNIWKNRVLGDRGTYASSGFAGGMFVKTSAEPDNNYGLLAFGGPVNFRGYFPGYSYNATMYHNYWTWAIIKSHPRNTAGTVKLVSKDPLDVPAINYNYFDTGSGDSSKDLRQITEAITVARNAFSKSGLQVSEVLPGTGVQSQAQLETYVKDTAWGHHASCTCAIGPDSDPNAVLDSSFRVRKVQGLRVVDASVYPKIPGTFTAASTYLVGEKAADVILSQNK